MLNQALYSSKNMCWCTPQDLYDQLDDEFHFVLDVANVIQSFYLCNKGDEVTTDLLLTVGAEPLGISPDKMLEMITEGF